MHYAALENNAPRVRDLLRRNDPNEPDNEGFTPLHFAAQEYAVEAARSLLEYGASVDAENRYGNTALYIAVFNSRGRGDMIHLLRSFGADIRHANQAGVTPAELADSIGNYDVKRFLADSGDS